MRLSVLLLSSLIARLQHDLMEIANGLRCCGSKRFVVHQTRKSYSVANLLQTSPNTYLTTDLWVLVTNHPKRFYKSLLIKPTAGLLFALLPRKPRGLQPQIAEVLSVRSRRVSSDVAYVMHCAPKILRACCRAWSTLNHCTFALTESNTPFRVLHCLTSTVNDIYSSILKGKFCLLRWDLLLYVRCRNWSEHVLMEWVRCH